MRIGLFGATGKTGGRVLHQALSEGHHVKVLVRSPEKLSGDAGTLEVITGDMTIGSDVDQVVKGVDAVIMAAGPVKQSPADMMERAYEIIRTSGLDYTVVRPPMLADEPGGVNLTGSYTPPKPIPVGRGDLAAFLLNAAVNAEWVGESPLVSYAERKS